LSIGPAAAPSGAEPAGGDGQRCGRGEDRRYTRVKCEDRRRAGKGIAGREGEPASQVFKNVKFLTQTRARTFLTIMSVGYADALGVTCAHCHNVQDFSSDEKRPKRAAREMQVLHRSVNTQLRAMTELASQPADQRAINCTTCHRGRIDPETPNP
jgi:hypothetical protein